MNDIDRWLSTPNIPILSIDGPGGTGKSELARAVAHTQLAKKKNVIWLERPDRNLPAALAAMISVRSGREFARANADDAPTHYIDLVDRIAEMRTLLGGATGLIVLDDVSVPSAVDCLTPSSNWKVLLTTHVAGLVVGAKSLHLSPLSASEALRILSRVAWEMDEPAVDDVVDAKRLVDRFGGNPLALEIAGATLRDGLSLTQYLTSLDAGEGAGAADTDAIHQALLRSLTNLDVTSKSAFVALAALPTTGATAQMVATTLSVELPDVQSSLKRLVRYNLVVQSGDTNRYSQHAALRDAALARLRQAGSDSWNGYHSGASKAIEQLVAWILETNGRRSDVVRARFREVADLIDGIDPRPWLDGAPGAKELGTALAIVADLRTSTSPDQQEEVLNRISALLGGEANQENEDRWRWAYFYQARAALRAARGLLPEAVSDLDAALDRFSDTIDRANVIEERAKLLSRFGRIGDAMREFGVALGMFRAARDLAGVANALFGLAKIHSLTGDRESAISKFDEALDAYVEIGEDIGRANVLVERARCYLREGRRVAATADVDSAIQILEAAGFSRSIGRALRLRSEVKSLRNDLDGALIDLSSALNLFEELDDQIEKINTRVARAELLLRRSELNPAASDLDIAINLARIIGEELGQANALKARAELNARRTMYDDAVEDLGESLRLYERTGSILGRANSFLIRGKVYVQQNKTTMAQADLSNAVALFQKLGNEMCEASALLARADSYARAGHTDYAHTEFGAALDIYTRLDNTLGQANVHRALGDLEGTRHNIDGAARHLERASELYRSSKENHGLSSSLAGLAQARALQGRADEAATLAHEAIECGRMSGNQLALRLASDVLARLAR